MIDWAGAELSWARHADEGRGCYNHHLTQNQHLCMPPNLVTGTQLKLFEYLERKAWVDGFERIKQFLENVGSLLDNGIAFGQALNSWWVIYNVSIKIMQEKVIKGQFLCIGWSVGFSAGQFWGE